MMLVGRFNFGKDGRDIGIGLDHRSVHLLVESVHLISEIGTRFLACVMGLFHLVHETFALGLQGGISCNRRVVGLVQFLLFRVGQHAQVVGTSRRRTGRRLICRLRE